MPRSKIRKSKNKQPKKMNASDKLLKLANSINQHDDLNSYQKVEELVLKQLDSGSDKALYGAYEKSNYDEYSILSFLFENISTEKDILMTTSDGNIEIGTSRLFVIPIIGVLDNNYQKELTEKDLNIIMKSFRDYGFLNPENSSLLSKTFFSLDDLPTTYFGAYSLHKDYLNYVSNENNNLQKRLNEINQNKSINQPTLSLRFLVGAFIGDDVEFYDDIDVESNNLTPDAEGWMKETSNTLGKYYNDNTLHVELPNAYFNGVKEGVFQFNAIATRTTFSSTINRLNLKPEELTISTSSLTEDNQISIIMKNINSEEPMDAVVWQSLDFRGETQERMAFEISELSNYLNVSGFYIDDKKIEIDYLH